MSSAAKWLGTNTATVSRRIEKLSVELDAQLFIRDGQHWSMTPLAEAMFKLAEDVEANLMAVMQNRDVVLGQTHFRISADLTILQTEIMRILKDLITDFPAVDFDISMFPQSLALGETDLALTYQEPTEGRVVRSKLLVETLALYTCRFHKERTEEWIRIVIGPNQQEWTDQLEGVFGRPARFTVHGLNVARQAMERLPLAAVLPKRYAERYPHLVEQPGFQEIQMPVWICFHESRRHDPVLRDIVTWLKSSLAGNPTS
ncbi:hypothetical protein ATO11_01170 [Pseudaestuariivita atlantica]|uniref:HTH lysR-type domain-containing protein n=2 Tax=Pseudaestuariivita atlantica TaxID=1317121 RepID=A0A0L1JU39_9RHOB|nr:hypothetical protein ATO11_01170 [Pseudaestuariivita atlantica]